MESGHLELVWVSISELRFLSLIVRVEYGTAARCGVSISELRFLSLIVRVDGTIDEAGDSFNLRIEILIVDSKIASANRFVMRNVSISELRFLSLIVYGVSCSLSIMAIGFNLRIEILIVDSYRLNLDTLHMGFVSISELRFLSLIEQECQHHYCPAHQVSISELRFLSLIEDFTPVH